MLPLCAAVLLCLLVVYRRRRVRSPLPRAGQAFVREVTPGEFRWIVLADREAKGAKKGAGTTEYIDPVHDL